MKSNENTPLQTPHPGGPSPRDAIRQLERRLTRLRRQLRMNLLVRAGSYLLVAIIGLALFSLLVDRAFRLTTPWRVASSVVYAGIAGWLLWRLLVRPWTVRLPRDVLAELLEKRYPELQDRLRSSLDFLRDERVRELGAPAVEPPARDRGAHLAVQMKRRVVREALRDVESLDFGAVVNTPAVVGPMSCAFFAIAVVLALAAPLGGAMVTWYERNVLFHDVEWPYRTRLVVDGFGPPEYSRGVPRGDPLLIRVRVEGDTPDRVRISVHYPGESRRYSLARENDRLFVFEEPRVSQDFTFEVAGGDFRSRSHHVRVLERPRVESLALRLEYPDYTEKEPEVIEGDIGELPVPEGCTVRVKGLASKPLRSAELELEGRRLDLVVSTASPREFRGEFHPADSGTATFHLHDLEGVPPDRPFTFFVQIVPDRAPTVRANPFGVSSMLTPDARIPLRIVADDDYRVTALGVAYRIMAAPAEGETDGEEEVEDTAAGTEDPESGDGPRMVSEGTHRFGALESAPQRLDKEEVWDIQPLEFTPGARLDVRITAFDNDGLHGSKQGESSPISFLIVTVDRLGEELLRREIEQRRALERALDVERGVRDQVYRSLDGAWNEEGVLPEDAIGEMVALARLQRQLAQQVAAIGQAIGQVLDEMRNNRIAEAADTARLADGIITPLEKLATESIRETVRRLGSVREESNQLLRVSHGWELAQSVELVIEELEHVLAFMRRMEGFTEIVHRLRGIIKTHREATAETRRLYDQAVDAIFDDDIFSEEGDDDREDDR